MAQSASIAKVSNKHEAILQFLIANPTAPLRDVAAAFGVTQPWLSVIIHSHAFQDQLARRQNELYDSTVVQPLGEKLHAAADMTIEAYLEKVPNLTADQLISASDKLLGRLGYGTNGKSTVINGNVTQNIQNNHVSKSVLEEARNRIGTHKVGETDSASTLPNGEAEEGIEAQRLEVRTSRERDVGESVQSGGSSEQRDDLHSESVVPVSTDRSAL